MSRLLVIVVALAMASVLQGLSAGVSAAADAPKLPEKNGTFLIEAQEWPLHPGPRTVRMWVHYPEGRLDKVNPQTGLMLSLHNWGGTNAIGTADPQKLADRYNVVAICVDYLQSGQEPLKRPEPYDFGYLQALDALRALHTVFDGLSRQSKPFDRGRIFCTGGSGGGNVTMMANKLAPRTFAVCIPLCGMSRLSDDIAFDLPGGSRLNAKYSRETGSPYYLSPQAQAIRDLGHPQHLQTMKTLGNTARVIIVHGESDDVCPFADAQVVVKNMQQAKLDVLPRFIRKVDLDGKAYRSTDHSLGDRTLIVFKEADRFLKLESPETIRRKGQTDFERRDEEVRYQCPNGHYVISYRQGYPVGRFDPLPIPIAPGSNRN